MSGEVVTIRPGQPLPESWSASLFIGGPGASSSNSGLTWQAEVVALVQERWTDDGRLVIFLPDRFADWSDYAIDIADVLLFWSPEDIELDSMLGMAAARKNNQRVVCGTPPRSGQSNFLLSYAKRHKISAGTSLDGLVNKSLAYIGRGALRVAGEREVPLHVWQTESFKRWYAAQTAAGNELRGAKIVWTFATGPRKQLVLYWALHVQMWVRAEQRIKSNEVVVSRPDISVLAFYRRGATIDETTVILVREFRSPASTSDGLVHELPGGSGSSASGARDQAVEEFEEETGLAIDADRIRSYGSRQLAATMSAHHAHLFAAEITDKELAWLRENQAEMHGADDTEQTWTEIATLGSLRRAKLVDWSTLGMIAEIALDVTPA